MEKQEKEIKSLTKSLIISIILAFPCIVFIIIGLTPLKPFKDMFLTGGVLYLASVIFWWIARQEAFPFLKTIKKSFINITSSKEVREDKKNNADDYNIKANSIGLKISLIISFSIFTVSLFIDIFA